MKDLHSVFSNPRALGITGRERADSPIMLRLLTFLISLNAGASGLLCRCRADLAIENLALLQKPKKDRPRPARVVQVFIDAGAHRLSCDPVYSAALYGQEDIVQPLLDAGVSYECLTEARTGRLV